MKIYNEVVSRFNETTGKWETVSEDSFEYGGPLAMAQGVPPNSKGINTTDTISDTIKTTTGYFSNGDGTLDGNSVFTGSLPETTWGYFFDVHNKVQTDANSEKQFSVTFGHVDGKGSDTYGDSDDNATTLKGNTQAIYQQLSEMLQISTDHYDSNTGTGGWKIASQGSSLPIGIAAGAKDEYIYALVGVKDRFKERMNKKVWTLTLTGSNKTGAGVDQIVLTDDSATTTATATPGGPRFNIVSGSAGVVSGSGASYKTYGFFYPEMGIMVFSGAHLSASLPGHATGTGAVATLVGTTGTNNFVGFAPNLTQTTNARNALRFVNSMRSMRSTTSLRLRSEEDLTEENYFCRIGATEYNFSSNHTFVSGSKNKIRNKTMWGNPNTFITSVGLFNSSGQLLAIAKLSKPLSKNFASEATIKVRLTY